MQVLDARLSSFAPILKPKSRAKPAFPLTPTTHPHLTPQNLAEAGFYHSSSQGSSDLADICRCFLCNVQLGGWDPGDDPFEEHLKRGGCAWAELVCALKVDGRRDPVHGGRKRTVYPTAESLPSSSQSTALREQTYQKDGKTWWPYKKKKDWLPTVPALAKAGFIYTPTSSDKDNATCPLCQYSVEGWEASDDPWHVHQKKFPECPFFTATADSAAGQDVQHIQAQVKPSKGLAKSQTSKISQDDPGNSVVLPPQSQPDESAPEDVIEVSPVKPANKPRVTSGASKSKSRSRKKAAEAEPELAPEEAEAVEIEDVASQAPSEVAELVEDKAESSKPARKIKGRPTKSRSKKKVDTEQVEEEEEQVEERRATIKASQRSKPSQNSQPTRPTRPVQASQPAQPPQPDPRPLSQLDRFANIPPSSPIVPLTPKYKSAPAKPTELPRAALDKSVSDGALQARRVIEELAKEAEKGLREPLTDAQKGMTLEELVRSEMRRRYEAMEREGEILIGKWEERTRKSRSCIEGV